MFWLNNIFIYILHGSFCKCLVHAILSLAIENMPKFTFQRFVDDVDHTNKFGTNWTMIRKSEIRSIIIRLTKIGSSPQHSITPCRCTCFLPAKTLVSPQDTYQNHKILRGIIFIFANVVFVGWGEKHRPFGVKMEGLSRHHLQVQL